ncbi:PREDICTED: spermine oxidase-like [Priapulus caudatus]|uniref:Spermine oxidase-like n=1 Tax=Priapulus caudatus TaxID=37621 RepID=A0ABM1EB12_PRICU|nr:PREDICTED: spermine oxidase-like [Priapulus caudatus]
MPWYVCVIALELLTGIQLHWLKGYSALFFGVAATAMTETVVIVGAGIAGLGAAKRLVEAGITDIIILEAQDRIGGRIHSVPYGNGFIDFGAQWIHGQLGNPVYRLAREHGLLMEPDCYEADLHKTFPHLCIEEENVILLTPQGERMPEQVIEGTELVIDEMMTEMEELPPDHPGFTSISYT